MDARQEILILRENDNCNEAFRYSKALEKNIYGATTTHKRQATEHIERTEENASFEGRVKKA